MGVAFARITREAREKTMTDQKLESHRPGRLLGALIFALGVGLLVVVFVLAAIAFIEVPARIAGPSGAQHGIGSVLAGAATSAVFLFVMAYAGSLVASKGLELYAMSRGAESKRE